MKSIVRILSIVFSCTLIISCGPKYTASFGPSQKFYTPEKPQLDENQNIAKQETATEIETEIDMQDPDTEISDEELLASTSVKTSTSSDRKVKEIASKFKEGGKFDKANISKMTKSEKRAVLKEAKKDIKALKKQSKITNEKIYWGVIIGLAGLVIAILASGSLGGLAILVGLILIIWGLVEQGSI